MHGEVSYRWGPKTVSNRLTGSPQFHEKAILAVSEVLRSGKVNYWTGKEGMELEKKFAEWQGSKYAISVATGAGFQLSAVRDRRSALSGGF